MPLCLTGLSIWDGEQLLEADCIKLGDDGRIGAVGASEDMARGSESIACNGAFAIPGLIDAHVHMELDPNESKPPQSADAAVYSHMAERAGGMVRAGITTARDLGGGSWQEVRLRNAIQRGEVLGPRLLCAGQPITCTGGHCHFWGGEAADIAQARAVIDRQLAHDVDLIKIMATGGRFTRGSAPLAPQFDLETVSAVVQVAHEHGRPVAAHCHGTAGIEVAARAGVDTIEHCSWVGEAGWASDYQSAVAEVILQRNIWVSPTVNRGWQRFLDSKTGAVLQRVRHAYQDMLGLGIPFVASTDAGIPGVFHADLAHALPVFAQIAQLSPEQTLRSATSDAARALGIQTETGRLGPGYAADVLVLDGNPLEDLSALSRPVGIWARGRAAILPS